MTERPNVDYSVMPIAELYGVLQASEAELARTKAAHAVLLNAVGERYTGAVQAALTADGRPSGTFSNIDIGDRFSVTAEISKSVSYDQDKLKALAGTLTWPEVCHYFKIEFTVPEAIYKAIPPGPVKTAIEAARTTKYGAPKLKIVPPAEAAA